jgi:hypothetical protein
VDALDDLLDRLPGGWRRRIPGNEPLGLALKYLQLSLAPYPTILHDAVVEVSAGRRDIAGGL